MAAKTRKIVQRNSSGSVILERPVKNDENFAHALLEMLLNMDISLIDGDVIRIETEEAKA